MEKYKSNIILIIVVIIFAVLVKCLYDFICAKVDEYYAGLYGPGISASIDASKERGTFLCEYEVDSLILADTFCVRPAFAYAERQWLHNYINPDSIIIDSVSWQAVIWIPQLNPLNKKPVWSGYNPWFAWEMQPEDRNCYPIYRDKTISFCFRDSVPLKDTIKYYFLYNFKDSIGGKKTHDTLTLFLTRKK